MSGKTSKSDSARISGSQARTGGNMKSGGFAARAQSAADRNVNANAAKTSGTGASTGAKTSGIGGGAKTTGGTGRTGGVAK